MAITKAVLDAAWGNQFADISRAFGDSSALLDLHKKTTEEDRPMTEMELLLHFPIGCKVVYKHEKDISSSFVVGRMAPDTVVGYISGGLKVLRGKESCFLDPRNYKVVEEK